MTPSISFLILQTLLPRQLETVRRENTLASPAKFSRFDVWKTSGIPFGSTQMKLGANAMG
jgi:hypothetical protein